MPLNGRFSLSGHSTQSPAAGRSGAALRLERAKERQRRAAATGQTGGRQRMHLINAVAAPAVFGKKNGAIHSVVKGPTVVRESPVFMTHPAASISATSRLQKPLR